MLLGRILRADSGVEGNRYLEHSSRKVFPVQAWECMKGCSKNKPRILGQSSWPEERHCATVSPWLQQLLLDTGCGRGSPVEKRVLRRPPQSFLSFSTATGGLRGIAGAVSPAVRQHAVLTGVLEYCVVRHWALLSGFRVFKLLQRDRLPKLFPWAQAQALLWLSSVQPKPLSC